MCGFLGYISKNKIDSSQRNQLDSALDLLERRGPDGRGVYFADNIFLGHRRLSIIDLSENASQPFHSADEKAIIIFNGEIYNYKEISEGLNLRTTSDTEVLIEGYLKYGAKFFQKIRGIYAFTILDKSNEAQPRILMLRDPAGIKPFYYELDENKLAFSSEIKSIIGCGNTAPEIDEEALKAYIHLGYVIEPHTIYRSVKALEPGVLCTLDINTWEIKNELLNDFEFNKFNTLSFEENAIKTREHLENAARRNMVADVEVNVALSGGIDSSLIYAYCNQVKPITGLTVAFDEKEYDESDTAKRFAQTIKANHKIVTTTVDDRMELLDNLLKYFDQPYADSSFVPFYFLSEAAVKQSKVLIGGDSGDEIHNGYAGHRTLPRILKLAKKWHRITPAALALANTIKSSRLRGLKKVLGIIGLNEREKVIFEWNVWQPTIKKLYKKYPFKYNSEGLYKIFGHNEKGLDDLGFIQKNYFRCRMQSDYLRKSDMMSMYNSLEFRVPMLDEDLVRFSLTIPYQQKSDAKSQKKILRYLHSLVFPPDTSQHKKKGFTIPLDTWLGNENLEKIALYLKRSDGIVLKYVEEWYINDLFDCLLGGKNREYISRPSAYQRILIFYSLQLWFFETYKKI
ncbi:asparagine synthase (glutamine-hydrolyzing) [Oscillatoria amoena NRMC-F 0135]|nr:asparagine synthase (glutamine-hydrolyzing) [Oscillatoria amoena NRMC-F 0135]